jgi:hypothetical protein
VYAISDAEKNPENTIKTTIASNRPICPPSII